MNIAVYLGSLNGTDQKIQENTAKLGHWIGKEKHTLVYGGGQSGLMGIVADSCLAENGKVIGVIPHFLAGKEITHESLTELHYVDTMAERKTMMIENADAFVSMPGGVGTLEEISEIMSKLRLNQTDAPCIFYNYNHFYDAMKDLLDTMLEYEFIDEVFMNKVSFCSTIEEVESVLTKYCQKKIHE